MDLKIFITAVAVIVLLITCVVYNVNILYPVILSTALIVTRITYTGGGLIHDLVSNGDITKLKELLACDVNMKDNNGRTALHVAASRGDSHVELVKFLCENKANLDIQDNNGQTALHVATASRGNSHVELVKFLCENKANLDIQDKDGQTALHNAAASRGSSLDMVKFLINSGVNLKIQDKYGKTVLHMAADSGNRETVKILIKSAPDLINIQDKDGQTCLDMPLMKYSGSYDGSSIPELLLENKVDPNIQDNNGQTILHSAVAINSLDAVKSLLKYNADPNIESKNGQTPLGLLMSRNSEMQFPLNEKTREMFKSLVESGSDTHSLNHKGESIYNLLLKRPDLFDDELKCIYNVDKNTYERSLEHIKQAKTPISHLDSDTEKGLIDIISTYENPAAKFHVEKRDVDFALRKAERWRQEEERKD
jgi:ankyrin repeat protein